LRVPDTPLSQKRRPYGALGAATAGAGSALAAVLASSCCVGPVIAPFVVAVLGASGAAWAAGLKPYSPYILAGSLAFLLYGPILKTPEAAWDVWMLYGRGVRWEGQTPPRPDWWEHQLYRMPPERSLDPERFARKKILSLERLESVLGDLAASCITEAGSRECPVLNVLERSDKETQEGQHAPTQAITARDS
jgi:hypothetical protein